jgi:hypothetical protein
MSMMHLNGSRTDWSFPNSAGLPLISASLLMSPRTVPTFVFPEEEGSLNSNEPSIGHPGHAMTMPGQLVATSPVLPFQSFNTIPTVGGHMPYHHIQQQQLYMPTSQFLNPIMPSGNPANSMNTGLNGGAQQAYLQPPMSYMPQPSSPLALPHQRLPSMLDFPQQQQQPQQPQQLQQPLQQQRQQTTNIVSPQLSAPPRRTRPPALSDAKPSNTPEQTLKEVPKRQAPAQAKARAKYQSENSGTAEDYSDDDDDDDEDNEDFDEDEEDEDPEFSQGKGRAARGQRSRNPNEQDTFQV